MNSAAAPAVSQTVIRGTATAAPESSSPPEGSLCVVGDAFEALTHVGSVQTVSQFVRSLRRGDPLPQRIVAGQGISGYEMEFLDVTLRTARATEVAIEQAAVERVSRGIAHKHREANVLLADLQQVAEREFAAQLRLHGDNELLQDHHTGQHVQGIVIIEAMRQMFIAVFEFAYGRHVAGRQFYVIWDEMNISFSSFLFPLPARIECRILHEDVADVARQSFRVAMVVSQNGVVVAEAEIGYGAHDHDKIRAVEDRRAGRAVRSLLGQDAEAVR